MSAPLNNKISQTRLMHSIMFMVVLMLGFNFLSFAFWNLETYKTIIRILSMLLLIFIYFLKKTIKERDLPILAMSIYCILINGSVSLNVAFLLILAIALNVFEESLVYKYMNIVNIIMMAIVIFSLYTGIAQNTTWTHLGRTRNDLGFVHVNFIGLFVFSITSTFLLLLKELKWFHLLLVFLFSYVIFRVSNSRTGFVGGVILITAYLIFEILPKRIGVTISLITESVLFISPFVWHLNFMNTPKMNELLSSRPRYFNEYISNNNMWNLFFGGSKVTETDNFFLMLLYNGGVLIYIALFVITITATKRLMEKKSSIKVAFIVSVLSMGFAESSIIRPEILCMPLFWMIVVDELGQRKTQFFDNQAIMVKTRV